MSVLLALILCVNLAFLAIILTFSLKIRQIYNQFRTFITPIDANTPSPLAQVTQTTADMLGRSLVAQIESRFIRQKSAEVRGETAVNTDIALDTISMANPAISAILQSFPTLRKTLKRNPALLDLALSKLAGGFGSGGGGTAGPMVPANGNNGNQAQAKFKL